MICVWAQADCGLGIDTAKKISEVAISRCHADKQSDVRECTLWNCRSISQPKCTQALCIAESWGDRRTNFPRNLVKTSHDSADLELRQFILVITNATIKKVTNHRICPKPE